MGKKKSKKLKGLDYDVSGVSIEQLINMDFKELAKYNETSVKKITSRLVSAYNKRLRYLAKSERGRMSPTYQFFEKREAKQKGSGFFSVKGKSKSTSISLFQQLQEKLQQKTSTVKGFKEYQKELYKNLKLDFKKDIEFEKKFWKIYNTYKETEDKTTENWKSGGGSPEVMQYILNKMGDWETMTDTQKQSVINQLYEELKITEQQEIDKSQMTESQLFDRAEDDEDAFEM